jgi:hypothetical protein
MVVVVGWPLREQWRQLVQLLVEQQQPEPLREVPTVAVKRAEREAEWELPVELEPVLERVLEWAVVVAQGCCGRS